MKFPIFLLGCISVAHGAAPLTYSPARPPALPLAVRSPYLSIWSSTSNAATLNSGSALFWTGSHVGWEGLVAVDGVTYRYLGTGTQSLPDLNKLRIAAPLTVSYDSQYSNFTFSAGPVTILASFFSPVLPADLCRTSIPLSYLTTSVTANDNDSHRIQFYSDVNTAMITSDPWNQVHSKLYRGNTSVDDSSNGSTLPNDSTSSTPIYTWMVESSSPVIFSEQAELPGWGYLTYSSSQGPATNFTYECGISESVWYKFVEKGGLSNTLKPEGKQTNAAFEPIFAFAHDFGSVSSASVMYTIGSIQQPIVRYASADGVGSLQPWWTKCYNGALDMISFHYNDFAESVVLAVAFESQLRADIESYYSAEEDIIEAEYSFDPNTAYGYLDTQNFSTISIPNVTESQSYYSLVALAARQIMGAYVFAVPPEGFSNTSNAWEPLMFQKEISSNGNMNTVDVIYPALPWFLYANPSYLRYLLDPLFRYQESGFYPNGWAMHDIGTHFPNATGHSDGNDEPMPVEECGNMILMTYAYYKHSGDLTFLQIHYPQLMKWAEYLVRFSLVPEQQLSTDDFAAVLSNQTNLAIKGIIALSAMSHIAHAVAATPNQPSPSSSSATRFASLATSYITTWQTYAIDPSATHTLLAYQWRSSWGLLYNTYPDLLLNLSTIPQHIYAMQSAWYPTVAQVFGVPLDSRHSYTKADWEMWTAATCSPATRRLFVNALAYWLNHTETGLALTDLYDTVARGGYPRNPDQVVRFIARPVQGGLFALLALEKAKKVGGVDGVEMVP